MVGGNLRLDDSVSGGSHDGYASGTDARGGAGIVLTNTSSSDDGQIRFVRQNDSNDDSWTVKESMRINASGYLGINDTDPISELSVAGKISITSESSTPTARQQTVMDGYTPSPMVKSIGNLTMLPRLI